MTVRRVLAALLWLLAIANVAIVAIRLVSLFETSSLVQIPNGEAVDLYAIWKLRHGYPLYEFVTRPPFSLTPYNYLFFYVYAGAMGLFHVGDEAMSFWARIPTLGFALAGAWVQYALVRSIARRGFASGGRSLPSSIAVSTWIGVGVIGWSALSIRPDVGAAAFGLVGLGLCWAALNSGRPGLYLVAGLAFACAWLFKQSFVMTFAGTFAWLVLRRRAIGHAVRLAAPFGIVIALSFAFGSPAYRFDAFRAQTFTSISIHDAQFWLRSGLLPNLLIWAIPVWWVVTGRRRVPIGEGLSLVIYAAVVTGAWALVTIGREGSSMHYLIEPSIPAAVWTSIVLSTLDGDPLQDDRGLTVAVWTTVPMVLFVAALLLNLQAVQTIVGLRARGDRLMLALPGEYARRAAIRDRMREVPPAFIRDEVLSLPWFSNRNTYPAVLIEHVVYDAVARKGLTGGGIEGLIRSRYFGGIFADPGSPLANAARAAGYVPRGVVPGTIGGTLEVYVR